jgi:hypothetical protein
MSELHDKAIGLIEGGVVEIDGHFVKASKVEGVNNPCEVCNMDSACRMNMVDLCAECETISRKRYLLKFAYE